MSDTGKILALAKAVAGAGAAAIEADVENLKSAINAMDTATASDVDKCLSPKTVSNGKVTEWQFIEGGGGSIDPSAIAEAVADWCDENITEDPTVVIDKSLLVDGAAADSKKAGDVIRSFSETTRNLFDDTIFATANDISVGIDGFYYGKSSKWVADFSSGLPFDTSFKSNTRYTISVRYYISNVATYTGSISAIKVYYTDGTSGNAIGFNASNTNEKYETVTTSANKTIDYISIDLVDGRGNDYIVHLKELQIEEGTSASYFIKHRTACDVIARSTASSLEKTTSALEKQIDVIDLNWELGYIKTSDGTNQNASVCIRSTDFILLNQGDKIYMDYDYMSRLYRYSSEDLSTFQAYYDYNYDSTLHYITGYYEIPVTGYYRMVVSDYVQSTIPSTDIAVVSNKIHLIRNSAINDLKGDVSINILPYNLTALKTYIDSLNNTKGDLMIPIVTDIHGGYQDTYPVINYLANSGIGNYFFELGDVINSTFATRADSIAYLRESFHSMAYTKTNTPIIMLQGNHDTNPLSGTDTTKNVTQEVFYNLSMARARGLHQPTNKAYGYVDIEEAKVRVIWLNTSDIFDATTGNALVAGQYTMIQQAQVQWFADIALDFTDKNTPTDWSVIIMSHDSLSQVASSAFANILTAFMNGTSYSGTQTVAVGTYSNVINYSCDFTQQGELTVICEVNGHHHKDMIRELGTTGIKQVYVACEGNASACYDNNGETAYYTRRRGTSDEHLIDTLVLDKTNRKVYFKRFGVGEDREINY